MTIKEFNEKYRIEPLTTIVGWGVDIVYVIYDKQKQERVSHKGDVYGQFRKFRSIEEALEWAETGED